MLLNYTRIMFWPLLRGQLRLITHMESQFNLVPHFPLTVASFVSSEDKTTKRKRIS